MPAHFAGRQCAQRSSTTWAADVYGARLIVFMRTSGFACTLMCMHEHSHSHERVGKLAHEWLQVQLDQLRRILVNEEYQYFDPVTDFVKAVYVDYDFSRAQV